MIDDIPLTEEEQAIVDAQAAEQEAERQAKRSLYIICPKALFESKYDEYLAKGFENRGAIRYNLNNTKVLIEEAASMFPDEDLALPGVQVFEANEINDYLVLHKNEWEQEEAV